MKWRKIDLVLMIDVEAVFESLRDVSNEEDGPRMSAEEFFELFGDDPPLPNLRKEKKIH